jgi:hypothetical protein
MLYYCVKLCQLETPRFNSRSRCPNFILSFCCWFRNCAVGR